MSLLRAHDADVADEGAASEVQGIRRRCMFIHPDTMYVIRQSQNQAMERHAAQQRLAATAQPSVRPRAFAVRKVAAIWLLKTAQRLADPEFSMRSTVSEASVISLSKSTA
jgi:hypothetical protein